MKSYTQGRAYYGSETKNTSAANLTRGDEVANIYYREICATRDWPFLSRLRTLTTVASTQFITLPYDVSQVRSVFVTVGTTRYTPKPSPSREHWDSLNYSTFTSDTPEWWISYNGQLGLWPIPATSSNTISVNAKIRVIDLSMADYTTGTIVSVANGGTAVVGSGTTWTSQMVGRYIRITLTDTVNTGDGQWYEISGVGSTTTLTLATAYAGTAIVAGSAAYTIGQMPLLPEEFHHLPWLKAAEGYWIKEDDNRGATYTKNIEKSEKLLEKTWSSPDTNMVIDDGQSEDMNNPNLYITL